MSLGLVLTPYGKIPGGYPPYAIDYAYKGAVDWYGSNSAGDAPNAPGNMDPRLDPQWFSQGEAGYYYDTSLGRTLGRALGRGANLDPKLVVGASTLAMIGGGVFGYRRAKPGKKFWPTVGWAFLASVATGAVAQILGTKSSNGVSGIPTDFQLATIRNYTPVEGGWIPTKQGYQTGPWLPPHGDPNWAGYPVPIEPLSSYPPNGLGRAFGQTPATVEDVVGVMNAHNDRAFALALVSTTAVAVSALLGVFRTLKLIREDARD